jgi:hypothetical protein
VNIFLLASHISFLYNLKRAWLYSYYIIICQIYLEILVVALKKDAKLSDCRKYRYALWRTWDQSKSHVVFIGLNPSTADELEDDPTLIRCMNYAKSWGYGGVCMANLFAFRSSDPKVMLNANDPVGQDNDWWLVKLSQNAGLVVAAWGNSGSFMGRSHQVKQLLVANLHCLKMNKSGEPVHPLYQKASLQPTPMHISQTF